MRRIALIAVLVALVGSACSSESESLSDTTTTAIANETTTTASDDTTTTTTEPPTPIDTKSCDGAGSNAVPRVNIAQEVTTSFIGTFVVTPVDLEQEGVECYLVMGDIGDPEDMPTPDLDDGLFGGWPREDPIPQCVFRLGLVVTTQAEATSNGELTEDTEIGVLGEIDGNPIVVAEVAAGTEVETVINILEKGVAASPVYAYTPDPKWLYGPASEPREVLSGQLPRATTNADGVHVVDIFSGTSTVLDQHGHFIIEIVRQMGVAASKADVQIGTSFASDDATVAAELKAGAFNSLSLGVSPCELPVNGEQTVIPPLGTAAAMLTKLATNQLAAAAGNGGESGTCTAANFPAAFDTSIPDVEKYLETANLDPANAQTLKDIAVAVGANSGPVNYEAKASFSQCGEVWFPGAGIVSSFSDGRVMTWDGTSFATPQAAALLVLGWQPSP